MTVYVDVLFLINFIVNYLLLRLTAHLCGHPVSTLRLLLGAAAGGLGALTVFLPLSGALWETACRLCISGVMVLLLWAPCRLFSLLKGWFFFLVLSAAMGGLLFAVFLVFKPQGMIYQGGVLYFDISAFLLLFNITAAYVILSLFDRLTAARHPSSLFYQIRFTLLGDDIRLDAAVDTGNALREPFSGLPVIVCGLDSVASQLSRENLSLLTSLLSQEENGRPFTETAAASKFRAIPTQSASVQG